MELKSIEYCLVGIDNVKGLKDDVTSVSSNVASFVESKSVFISKFKSHLTPLELNKVFDTGAGRTFFIFELTPVTATVHIDISKLHKTLFTEFDEKAIELDKMLDKIADGTITKIEPENKDAISDLFKNIFGLTTMYTKLETENNIENNSNTSISSIIYPNFKTNTTVAKGNKKEVNDEEYYTDDELSSLSKKEKDKLVNRLLMKGKKLTDNDKKILSFLAKS